MQDHLISSLDEHERAVWQGTLTQCHAGGYAGNPHACNQTARMRSYVRERSEFVPSSGTIIWLRLNAMNGPN